MIVDMIGEYRYKGRIRTRGLSMNKRKKGSKLVGEAMDQYVRRGWLAWKPGNALRRLPNGRVLSVSQDIAQAFDFMAWNIDQIHFVQVKSNKTHLSKARSTIDEQRLPTINRVYHIVLIRVPGKPYLFDMHVKLHNGVWVRMGLYGGTRG